MIETKSPEVRYLTHTIIFPDDDAFIEQLPFVHDIEFEAQNWMKTIFHHMDDAKELVADLLRYGEARTSSRYPPAGITAKIIHLYQIEDKERQTGWFGTQRA